LSVATIDLNSDMGEAFGHWTMGDDDALLAVVTSANVACGFHAGDPSTMRRVCERAAERGVSIGAHVGYRDLAGFGRRFIDVPPEQLRDDVLYQIAALAGFAQQVGTRVRYVKPHGALYNAIVTNTAQAAAVVAGVQGYDASLPVLGLTGSKFLKEAQAVGLPTFEEAFADRAYTSAGQLLPRREPGAVLHDPAEIADRCLRMVLDGTVATVDGGEFPIRPASLCVHGDTQGAVKIAERVRDELAASGVQLRPFA
jgi:UPF0271 protein